MSQGNSVASIAATIVKAVEGKYVPKQFDGDDFDAAMLVLRTGGPRLLYATQQIEGHMSVKHALSSNYFPNNLDPFYVCPTSHEEKHMKLILGNIEGSSLMRNAGTHDKCLHAYIVDDIAIEQKIRCDMDKSWCPSLCREHSQGVNVDVTDYKSVANLKALLAKGVVHVGKEVTVGCIGPIRSTNNQAVAIWGSPTCKKDETAEGLEIFHHYTLKIWSEHPDLKEKQGPIASVATDGAANFCLAGHNMFGQDLVDAASPLGAALGPLVLFDKHLGHGDASEVADMRDAKHVAKTVHTLARSESRCIQIVKHSFSGLDLKDYLKVSRRTDG